MSKEVLVKKLLCKMCHSPVKVYLRKITEYHDVIILNPDLSVKRQDITSAYHILTLRTICPKCGEKQTFIREGRIAANCPLNDDDLGELERLVGIQQRRYYVRRRTIS